MSAEMPLLVEAFGYGWADLQWLTINAMKCSFIPFDERLAIINEVIKPAYAKLAHPLLPADRRFGDNALQSVDACAAVPTERAFVPCSPIGAMQAGHRSAAVIGRPGPFSICHAP